MVDKPRWEVPEANQPRPDEVQFDLDETLLSVVSLEANIPDDAFTAQTLGRERAGSAVVIRESGLLVTIGYLVTEAEDVVVIDSRGRKTPAHPVAIDGETGFALVQSLGDLGLPAAPLGKSSSLSVGEPVVMAGGGGGRQNACRARVTAKQEFSGYWEYHIDNALFTAPAHPLWGGAGLIGADGRLVGIGSLHVQQTDGRGQAQDVNMSVPIDLLTSHLDELLKYGRRNRPARPWLGVYSAENSGRVMIADVSEVGPAAQAGLRSGDIVASVRDASIDDLSDFYREVWSCGPAGAEIPIEIVRDKRSFWVRVKSADRNDFLRKPRPN